MSRLATRQFGRIATWQLVRLGVPRSTISDWTVGAYLHRVLPGVYAVGHRATSDPSELAAALLYAGRGAMLSHSTAAWWYGWLDDERPRLIDISTHRRRRSWGAIRIHGRRAATRVWHAGLPVTPPAQTFLDLAAIASTSTVRFALANADFDRKLYLQEVRARLGRGRPGASNLRRSIDTHEPRLARTKSRLERGFLELCERHRIPLPEVNVRVEGFTVDAVWREQRVVIELDGFDNHGTPAQIHRDRRRDLRLRAAGYVIVRYTWEQINGEPELVAADIQRLLSG